MSKVLYRIGRGAAERPLRVIGAWLVVAVAVVALGSLVGQSLEDTFDAPGLDSTIATDLLSRAGSSDAGLTAQVIATPNDPASTFLDSPDARASLAALHLALADLSSVVAVSEPGADSAAGIEEAIVAGDLSPDARVARIVLQYPVLESLSHADLDELTSVLAAGRDSMPSDLPASLRIEAGGDLFFAFEEPVAGIGELFGLLVAMLVLLVAFGSVVAMGLPIGMALVGLVIGLASLPILARVVEIPSAAPQMAAMIGIGVGIDYALFLVTRHREQLAAGAEVADSVGRAVATAGQAVVYAGGTVVVAILGLAVAGIPFVTAVGVAISVVVLVMVAASLSLLPALLGALGHRVDRWRLPVRQRRRSGVAASECWHRWARHVSRHAIVYTVGVTLALLALAAPALALQLGVPDEGTLAPTRTERRAYDLVADAFGPGMNGPLLVAVDLRAVPADRAPAVVESARTAISADRGIASVRSVAIDAGSEVASIVAIPTSAPQDAVTRETVDRLRAEVLPVALDGSGARAHVGGQTATFSDLSDRVADRLPYFVAAVLVLSFLLLAILFRSLLVPLKAVLLNLLSIGASYGMLVMVFQWGWGGSLIGLESTVPIVSFIPLLMFAIVFGLSMDYEVFLLSRMRERYLDTGDAHEAIVHGLASTARVITCAALIMVSVFSGFVLGDDPTVKMLGLGLAVAILIDATVVRLVLVPATMTLLGGANWWLPAWLDRDPRRRVHRTLVDEARAGRLGSRARPDDRHGDGGGSPPRGGAVVVGDRRPTPGERRR